MMKDNTDYAMGPLLGNLWVICSWFICT